MGIRGVLLPTARVLLAELKKQVKQGVSQCWNKNSMKKVVFQVILIKRNKQRIMTKEKGFSQHCHLPASTSYRVKVKIHFTEIMRGKRVIKRKIYIPERLFLNKSGISRLNFGRSGRLLSIFLELFCGNIA